MATSNSYNFNKLTADDIILEAYERCGILGDLLSGLQVASAKASLNFMMSQWVNRGLNLWTIDKGMFQIVPGQPSYNMPTNTVDILEAVRVQATRLNTTGAANASSGVAANAFDNDPTTSCTQNAADGWISWDYGVGNLQSVSYVGIQTNESLDYTLAIEYSFDGTYWINAFQTLKTPYTLGTQTWWVVPAPISARFWRIKETGGETLNIQELYFSLYSTTNIISRISREDYIAYPNKTQQSSPSTYYFDRLTNPSISLYPTPDTTWQYIVYNRTRYIQDIDSLLNNFDAPQRFYEALAAGLAAKLALKFAPDRFESLDALAHQAYQYAAQEDTQNVPLRIQPTFISYT